LPKYQIAGLVIDVDSTVTGPFKDMADYMITQPQNTDLSFSFQTTGFIKLPQGELISEEGVGFKWLETSSDPGGFCVYTCRNGTVGEVLVMMNVNPDWRRAVITWANIKDENTVEQAYIQKKLRLGTHILMGIAFRYCYLHISGLVIHASTIKWQNQGIMFSAPSGTGKSTQVKLWQENIEDVIVLNDDNPAVRFIDDKPYVFGTPWSGSSNINSNDFAPLSAIILLEQSPRNSIRRLTVQEAILNFMPRAFLPYFNQKFMNTAMDIFERIVSTVPVYLLKCRPDKEAVELVYKCLI
jgi:hypothetical protein